MTDNSRMKIKISGQEFTIKSQPGDAARVERAVKFVEDTITSFQECGERDVLRLYLMVAFDLAFELIGYHDYRMSPEDLEDMEIRLDNIKMKVLHALKPEESERNHNIPS